VISFQIQGYRPAAGNPEDTISELIVFSHPHPPFDFCQQFVSGELVDVFCHRWTIYNRGAVYFVICATVTIKLGSGAIVSWA